MNNLTPYEQCFASCIDRYRTASRNCLNEYNQHHDYQQYIGCLQQAGNKSNACIDACEIRFPNDTNKAAFDLGNRF